MPVEDHQHSGDRDHRGVDRRIDIRWSIQPQSSLPFFLNAYALATMHLASLGDASAHQHFNQIFPLAKTQEVNVEQHWINQTGKKREKPEYDRAAHSIETLLDLVVYRLKNESE